MNNNRRIYEMPDFEITEFKAEAVLSVADSSEVVQAKKVQFYKDSLD